MTLPTSVKVFVNKTTLGFDDAESTTPTQEFTLSAEDFASGAAELKLKFHKFQRVTSVHVSPQWREKAGNTRRDAYAVGKDKDCIA